MKMRWKGMGGAHVLEEKMVIHTLLNYMNEIMKKESQKCLTWTIL